MFATYVQLTWVACSQAVDELDSNGWSAAHHACDATTWCRLAMLVSLALVRHTPPEILNARTTGSQPRGYTCLHFACDGSDKSFGRKHLVRALLRSRADKEARTEKGNTPLLLASSTGVTDVVKTLIAAKADVNARNDRQLGAYQAAGQCSGSLNSTLGRYGLAAPERYVPSAKQRTGKSESRQLRHLHWHEGQKQARRARKRRTARHDWHSS